MSDLEGGLRPHCLHCSAPLDPPARRRGQEKKFCSSVCRSHYHAALRARAWERYRDEMTKELEGGEASKEKTP